MSRVIQRLVILMRELLQLKYAPCQIQVTCVRLRKRLVHNDVDGIPGCSSETVLIDCGEENSGIMN